MRNTLERLGARKLERIARALIALLLTVLIAYIGINAYAIITGYAAAPGASVGSVVVGSLISIGLDLWPAFLAITLLVVLWIALHRVLSQRSNKRIQQNAAR